MSSRGSGGPRRRRHGPPQESAGTRTGAAVWAPRSSVNVRITTALDTIATTDWRPTTRPCNYLPRAPARRRCAARWRGPPGRGYRRGVAASRRTATSHAQPCERRLPWNPLAKDAVYGRHAVRVSMAFQVARLEGVSIDDLLARKFATAWEVSALQACGGFLVTSIRRIRASSRFLTFSSSPPLAVEPQAVARAQRAASRGHRFRRRS